VRFDDFVLQLEATSRGGFRARVVKSPFGEGAYGFSPPALEGEELEFSGISRAIRHLSPTCADSTAGRRPSPEIGAELYRAVFQGQVRTLLDKSRGQLEREAGLGLRLKIKIDPSEEEAAALADLPWELLCDDTEDFLALSRQTSLVRYLDVPRSSQPIPFTPPLKILAVGASPHGLEPLDLAEEMRRLDDLNRLSGFAVEVKFLPHASAGAVRESLSADAFHVLHFMGHGTFDGASGEGMLAFEAAEGSQDLVSGKAFATKLRDLRSLGVVVLNACDTARAGHRGGTSPFRGVATALVLGGVPAVVAMQRPISDRAAIGFSSAFYRHLARGDSIDEALTEGRQAIHSALPDAIEWATPVLFLRIPEGNVFVAKPAVRPEATAPPAPAPAAIPLEPQSPRLPVPSRRGSALKIAAGAAGAVLISFVVYNKAFGPSGDSTHASDEASHIQKPLPIENESTPKTGGSPGPRLGTGGDRRTAQGTGGRAPVVKPQDTTGPQSSPPPAATPRPVYSSGSVTAEPIAAAADLANLSAQVVSIVRRDEGGLRVTVSFKNGGALPLSTDLDAEGSVLSDNQGQRYSVLDFDLPSSGSNPRLELAAGASSRHTFDFPAPKLGSKQFYLALAAQGGRRLRVSGSPITLEGSP